MENNLRPCQERRPDCPSHLYHYTSLQALIGIIQKKKLLFRGTRYDSMNDPVDYTFAADVVIPKLLSVLEKEKKLNDEETDYCEMYPYTVSFSENKDDESMWKHYGSDVSLEIDTSTFYPKYDINEKIKFFFDKCIYVNEEQLETAFITKWQESLQFTNIPAIVQYACVYIKRDAFQREKEWRIFTADYRTGLMGKDGVFYETEIPQDVKVSMIREKDIILYKEFEFPMEALTGIIINDNDPFHFHKVKKHIQLLLISNGFPPGKIKIRQTCNYPL